MSVAVTVKQEANALAVLGVDASIPVYSPGYPTIDKDKMWRVRAENDHLVVEIVKRDSMQVVRKSKTYKNNVDGHNTVVELMRGIVN